MNAEVDVNESLSTSIEGGSQDVSGWGLLGLTAGILTGFFASFYLIVPMIAKDQSTLTITLLTTIVMVASTLGGTVGYMTARTRRSRA